MSLNISGEKCSVCDAYLFEEDDVVYCAECGAPHHRECYNSIGHCGLQEFHGTDKQYQKPKTETEEQTQETSQENVNTDETVCRMCGETYPQNDAGCPKCGAPNMSKMGGKFVVFDFLGGVPADMDLGDGVTADEAKMFVNSNTQRYIPKFAKFKAGKRASWNWLAFLVPCAWFASRKMYAKSALVGALQIAFTMLLLPFSKAISFLDFSDAKNYVEMSNVIMNNISSIGTTVIAVAFIGSLLNIIIRIVCGIFGDYSYRNRVITQVLKIRSDSEDKNKWYRKYGGVSLSAALIGIMAVEYLPQMFAMIFGLL